MITFIKLYFLDILNWFYFRRVIAKYYMTPQWKKLNLRKNFIGEIYTVVRLRDEDLGDPDEIVTTRLMEITKDANVFIADMDIQFSVGGLVTVDYFHIPKDPNAFLIMWQPKLQVITVFTTLKFITIISLLITAIIGLVVWITPIIKQLNLFT